LGDYQLEAELGRGSMGAVYRATYLGHTIYLGQGKSCAVKVLLDALATDTSFVTRFKREANIAATLRHPNIIRVFDAGIQGEHIFFAMEYFEGMTAGRLLKQRKQFTPPQVVEMAVQASDALAYAHVEGHVVHRDIKPENLMVDRWWRTKVLDFGLARLRAWREHVRDAEWPASASRPDLLRAEQLDSLRQVPAVARGSARRLAAIGAHYRAGDGARAFRSL
jgi:serine/threonine-protein kinase